MFRVGGVPVQVHWTFGIPVVLPFLHAWFERPLHALVLTVVVAVVLFSAVLLHELGHLAAARRNKIAAERIELYLFGGRIRFKPHGALQVRWAWIYVAGPLVNIALGLSLLAGYYLASAGGIGYRGFSLLLPPLDAINLLVWTFALGAAVNLFLGVLNLLPALPLDGGFIVRELLRPKLGQQAATRLVGVCGVVLSLLRIPVILWAASIGFLIWLPPPFGPNWSAARGVRRARPSRRAPEAGESERLEWHGKGGWPTRR